MTRQGAEAREPQETELKLRFPRDVRARIEAHPTLQPPGATAPEQRHEESVYFDTPDHRLAARGLSLRVRHSDGQHEQTVKAAGPPGVATTRGEWTWPVTGDRPDLARLAEVDLELSQDLAAELRPVLSTEIERTRRKIALDGALIEADLDVGRIVAGDRSEEVAELELELLEGRIDPLYRLALALHSDLPLRIETESKAARGWMLSGQAPAGAAKARDLSIDPSIPAADALRRILDAGLGQLLGNLRPAGAGDAEGVHQARVALRRVRAALVLFEPQLEPHAVGRFNEEIRRLGRVFGEARDWDVFVLETLPAVEASASAAAWVPLLRGPAEAARRVAHDAVKTEIAEPAITGLVLSLEAWAESGVTHPEIIGRGMDAPIASVAPSLLDRLADKLDARGRHLAQRKPEELHELRKTLKKLRYAVDALESLHRRKVVKPYIAACKKLQTTLGDLNDARVTVELAERLAAGRGTDLTPAIGALAQWSEGKCAKARRRLADAWADFQATGRFWG